MRQRPVPPSSPQRRPLRSSFVLAGIGLVALGTTLGFAKGPSRLDLGAQEQRLLPVPTAFAARVPPAPPRATLPRRAKPQPAKRESRPVHISIPAIGVSAPLIPLGVNPDHTVQVPTSFSQAGWFRFGPRPGEVGAALIVGHVDSKAGPGVFFHLAALRHGDRILIQLANRRSLRFVVTSSVDAPKHNFPADLVFAHTRRPTLRLVTCGGRFDATTGHYVDNHIVFAWLVGPQ
jgi:sortase (surface protein transpeptidase)